MVKGVSHKPHSIDPSLRRSQEKNNSTLQKLFFLTALIAALPEGRAIFYPNPTPQQEKAMDLFEKALNDRNLQIWDKSFERKIIRDYLSDADVDREEMCYVSELARTHMTMLADSLIFTDIMLDKRLKLNEEDAKDLFEFQSKSNLLRTKLFQHGCSDYNRQELFDLCNDLVAKIDAVRSRFLSSISKKQKKFSEFPPALAKIDKALETFHCNEIRRTCQKRPKDRCYQKPQKHGYYQKPFR